MDNSKRQNLPVEEAKTKNRILPAPVGLWVVATPIGNLQDLSARAKAALEVADAILCEDTRRTSHLISFLGLSKRLERLDAHSGPRRIEEIVERMQEGESLALVTDAGTPGVSDPAAALVSAARKAGIVVSPIPGVSAVTALMSVSGISETIFAFCGFFPRKSGDQERQLKWCMQSPECRVFVWFESPERISKTLDVVAKLAPESLAIVGKELTKVHERIFSGDSADIAREVREELEREGSVGEWCFAIQFAEKKRDDAENANCSDWVKALQCLLDVSVPTSEAVRQVSQHFGAPKKTIYEMALKLSGKK